MVHDTLQTMEAKKDAMLGVWVDLAACRDVGCSMSISRSSVPWTARTAGNVSAGYLKLATRQEVSQNSRVDEGGDTKG